MNGTTFICTHPRPIFLHMTSGSLSYCLKLSATWHTKKRNIKNNNTFFSFGLFIYFLHILSPNIYFQTVTFFTFMQLTINVYYQQQKHKLKRINRWNRIILWHHLQFFVSCMWPTPVTRESDMFLICQELNYWGLVVLCLKRFSTDQFYFFLKTRSRTR